MVKALEKATAAKVYPVSAPLEEGMEPLLDAVIERLGKASEQARENAREETSWSPL
jgi:GTP-binding protein